MFPFRNRSPSRDRRRTAADHSCLAARPRIVFRGGRAGRQRPPAGSVVAAGPAPHAGRALHSSSRVCGSLNRCGSFGRGSNIFSAPDPTHLIFAV